MRFSEKLLVPLIVITLITAVGCYYILDEYSDRQFEIKKGIAEEVPEKTDIASDDDLKASGIAILVGRNEDDRELSFESLDGKSLMKLSYDGKTKMLSKRGKILAASQIQLGEILDVTYSTHSKVINEMQISNNAWSQSDISKFEINQRARTIKIGDRQYRMDDSVVVSYGDELANLIDVTKVDTIKVCGKDKRVCSIIVEKGHGYLRLENDAYFIGGWVEVGQAVIKPISEGMLLPVPEGNYHLRVTNRGYAGDEDIVITRDAETKIDLSEIDIREVAIGHVKFDITPDYAQLFIDGQMQDYEDRVPLEYGVHKIHVELAGYNDVDTNIKVTQEYADVSIELEVDEKSVASNDSSEKQELTDWGSWSAPPTSSFASSSSYDPFYVPESSSRNPLGDGTTIYTGNPASSTYTSFIYIGEPGSSSSSSSSSSGSSSGSSSSSSSDSSSSGSSSSSGGSSTDGSTDSSSSSMESTSSSSDSSSSSTIIIGSKRKLYVDAPIGAEVYINGEYIGIAPAACEKPIGEIIITLSASNCKPKSYTVEVENDDKDVTYSFSELESLVGDDDFYSLIL